MRASKLAFFLRPQEFEKEQYQSGTRIEQYISGYGKKTEQYISGYTPSKGVAYQFKDLSKVTISIIHGYSTGYGTNKNVSTQYMSIDLNGKILGNTAVQNYSGVLNLIARWADAKVGGPSYVGVSYHGLEPTTYKDVLLTFTERTGMGLAFVPNTQLRNSSTLGWGSPDITYEATGLLIASWVSAIDSSKPQYGNPNMTFITRIDTTPENMQRVDAGVMPIFSTREVDDTSKPIYSERTVPVYDYRWKEISPK